VLRFEFVRVSGTYTRVQARREQTYASKRQRMKPQDLHWRTVGWQPSRDPRVRETGAETPRATAVDRECVRTARHIAFIPLTHNPSKQAEFRHQITAMLASGLQRLAPGLMCSASGAELYTLQRRCVAARSAAAVAESPPADAPDEEAPPAKSSSSADRITKTDLVRARGPAPVVGRRAGEGACAARAADASRAHGDATRHAGAPLLCARTSTPLLPALRRAEGRCQGRNQHVD
jgi:hypothetical protein